MIATVATLLGAGCGSNSSTNPNPLLPYSKADGSADAIGGATSGSAGSTPGTSTTPGNGAPSSRLDGGIDGLVAGVTFTELYNNVFVVSCSGGDCHNPGSHHGVSFFTQSNGYASVRGLVRPGDPSGSALYQIVANGQMPPSGPPLSAADLAMIASWINAGALNN